MVWFGSWLADVGNACLSQQIVKSVLELGFTVVVCLSAAVRVGPEVAAFECDVVV